MRRNADYENIYLQKLVASKIPALSGRASGNNKSILETLALNGPLLKYRIAKHVKGGYATVSRRTDDLVKSGYLAEAGKKTTERGKQSEESTYGLRWKGFIASITFEEVRNNIPKVLRMNPLLVLPEKELVLELLDELMTRQEMQVIVNPIVVAMLETISNLELVEDEQLPMIMMSALTKISLPQNFKLSKIPENAWELLDRPAILRVVRKYVVPYLREFANQIRITYQLISALSGLGALLCSLEPKDQPSKRVKEFFEERSRSFSKIKALV